MKRMALIILAFMGTVKYLDAQQSQQVSRDEVINVALTSLAGTNIRTGTNLGGGDCEREERFYRAHPSV